MKFIAGVCIMSAGFGLGSVGLILGGLFLMWDSIEFV